MTLNPTQRVSTPETQTRTWRRQRQRKDIKTIHRQKAPPTLLDPQLRSRLGYQNTGTPCCEIFFYSLATMTLSLTTYSNLPGTLAHLRLDTEH
eukprot:2375080-Pleurochrysis_carterae.AAC.1